MSSKGLSKLISTGMPLVPRPAGDTGEVPIPASGQTLIDPEATTESRLFYRAIRVP